MSLWSKLRNYPRFARLKRQIATTHKLLNGPDAWHVMDRLGISGHGTQLIRIDFPPSLDVGPLWGGKRPLHAGIQSIMEANRPEQENYFAAAIKQAETYLNWPEEQDPLSPDMPWRKNQYLPPLDAMALAAMLVHRRPRRYLEIGSGISTRIAANVRQRENLKMEIVSIDPQPRVEVEQLCDRVERRTLESMNAEDFLAMVEPDTVVFFDGSHRTLPCSDVTWFFLEILPRLPTGTMVHVHDIYLPADYPSSASNRYWSEQYLLAAYLLGGADRIRITLPCTHLASLPAFQAALRQALHTDKEVAGFGFWMEIEDSFRPKSNQELAD